MAVDTPDTWTHTTARHSRFENIVTSLEWLLENGTDVSSPFFEGGWHLDLGFIAPAFYVATQCADDQLRARARSLLEDMDITEGLWTSKVAACISQMSVDFRQPLIAGRPGCPVSVDCQFRETEAELVMQFAMSPQGHDGPCQFRKTFTDQEDLEAFQAVLWVSPLKRCTSVHHRSCAHQCAASTCPAVFRRLCEDRQLPNPVSALAEDALQLSGCRQL